jgi:hypothetical protein
METPTGRRTAPTVHVEREEETVDVRAWARAYVNILCTLEGVALIPSALKQAS